MKYSCQFRYVLKKVRQIFVQEAIYAEILAYVDENPSSF